MSETKDNLSDTIGQFVGLFVRQRWWILGPTFLLPLMVIAVVFKLPNKYTSEATLVVVQQQVSQRFVDPFNITSSADMVSSVAREVLSQARLLAIIDAFGLYSEERTVVGPDRLAARLRKSVGVDPIGPIRNEFSVFKLSFSADNPRLAQEVNGRLASIFIEENLKTRGNQASSTTKFLTEQLEAAKQRLSEQGQKLQDFKIRNLNVLPEQEQANLGMLTDLRMQLQNAVSNQTRLQQQRISLESWLNGNRARLQSERATLLTRYTPKHAEVLQKDQEIERTDALLAQLRTGALAAEKPQTSTTPDDPSVAQLRGQVASNLSETETASKDVQRLRLEISQYQGRLRLDPAKQQQMAALLRDYELFQQDYTSLLNKQLGSQLTANLEERQEGQQFRLVDPPTLPSVPSSPKRLPISLGGAAAGIVLGAALAFIMDNRTRTFHTEKEVRKHLGAPLVVGLPIFYTPAEERTRFWKLTLEWVVGTALLLIVAAAELYVVIKTLRA